MGKTVFLRDLNRIGTDPTKFDLHFLCFEGVKTTVNDGAATGCSFLAARSLEVCVCASKRYMMIQEKAVQFQIFFDPEDSEQNQTCTQFFVFPKGCKGGFSPGPLK